jgi:PAS domain S-box-containing protein
MSEAAEKGKKPGQIRERVEKRVKEKIVKLSGLSVENVPRLREALRETNAYLDNLFNYANAPIIVWSPQFKIARFNHAFELLTGRSAGEVLGQTLDLLFPPAQVQPTMELIRKALRGERWQTVEIEILHRDGTVRTVLWNSATLFDSDGKTPVATIAQGHDITERKKAEEELRSSEEKFSKAFNLSHSAVFITTLKEGRFIEINKTGLNMFGYKPDEIIGRTAKELGLWVDLNDRATLLGRLQKEGVVRNMEVSFRRKWGEVFAAIISVDTVDIGGQQFLLSTNTDITARKKAEQEIERYNKLLHETGEMAKVGGWEFDVGTLKQTWTEEVYHIHEVDMDYQPTVEKGIKFYAPEAIPVISKATQKIIENGEPFDLELPFITAKGNHRWVHAIGKAYCQDGKTVKVGGTFQDITGRKKTEQKIQDYQKRLKSLASRLLLTGEHEKQKIASGLHDNICQKLALSKVNLQFSIKSISDAQTSNLLTSVCAEIDNIIKDIHSLTFELRNPVLHEIGLMAAIEKYLVEEIQEKHGIRFELNSDLKGKELTETIRGCLYRNIRELLVNVVKHAQAHQIKVRIYKSADHIHVCVEDDGAGFDTGRIALLPTRTEGFGLFSIREQLEYLGGNIRIESQTGHGTKVTMTLPLGPEESANVSERISP